MCPSSQRRSGSWPSSSGPVASRPPLGIGLLRWPRGDSFHRGVFHALVFLAWGGLLAALPEVRLPGMGCWCTFRVPQILCLTPLAGVRSWLLVSGIAVRALPLAMSLPLSMDVYLAPGRCLSVSTFYGLYLYPYGSCSEVPGPPVLLSSYAARAISCGMGVLSSLSPFRGCLFGSSELGWGSVELLRTSDVRVFFSECTFRLGLGLD